MACWTYVKPNQTQEERTREIQKATANIARMIAAQKVKIKVGPQGAVTFLGVPSDVRDGMSDSCVFAGLSRFGSQAFKNAVARAEQMAGVKVDPAAIEAGIHSHDGGATWGSH